MPCMAVTSQSFEDRVLKLTKALFTRIVASNEEIKRFHNYFDEHDLFVVPRASLRLKSISNIHNEMYNGRAALSCLMILFPTENCFTMATKHVISSMQSFTKNISGRKGKYSAEIFPSSEY